MKAIVLTLILIIGLNVFLSAQVFQDGFIKNNAVLYVKNVQTGKYLTVRDNSTAENATIEQSEFTGNDNQKFKFIKFGPLCGTQDYGDGSFSMTDCYMYKIKSIRSGRYLKIKDSHSSNNVRLIQSGTKGTKWGHHFYIEKKRNDQTSLIIGTRPTFGHKVLQPFDASLGDGVRIVQKSKGTTYTPKQNFIFELAN